MAPQCKTAEVRCPASRDLCDFGTASGLPKLRRYHLLPAERRRRRLVGGGRRRGDPAFDTPSRRSVRADSEDSPHARELGIRFTCGRNFRGYPCSRSRPNTATTARQQGFVAGAGPTPGCTSAIHTGRGGPDYRRAKPHGFRLQRGRWRLVQRGDTARFYAEVRYIHTNGPTINDATGGQRMATTSRSRSGSGSLATRTRSGSIRAAAVVMVTACAPGWWRQQHFTSTWKAPGTAPAQLRRQAGGGAGHHDRRLPPDVRRGSARP